MSVTIIYQFYDKYFIYNKLINTTKYIYYELFIPKLIKRKMKVILYYVP